MQGEYNICKSMNTIYYINKRKHKIHMIISIEAVKAIDNVQYPLMIKTFSNMEIEGAYLNKIKAVYKKPTANIILNW